MCRCSLLIYLLHIMALQGLGAFRNDWYDVEDEFGHNREQMIDTASNVILDYTDAIKETLEDIHMSVEDFHNVLGTLFQEDGILQKHFLKTIRNLAVQLIKDKELLKTNKNSMQCLDTVKNKILDKSEYLENGLKSCMSHEMDFVMVQFGDLYNLQSKFMVTGKEILQKGIGCLVQLDNLWKKDSLEEECLDSMTTGIRSEGLRILDTLDGVISKVEYILDKFKVQTRECALKVITEYEDEVKRIIFDTITCVTQTSNKSEL